MTKRVSAPVLRLRVAALLAGTCLGATSAQAVDGTWLAAPATNEWTTATNWSSSPAVPDGTATFGASNITSLNISGNTSIGTIQLDTGAPAYSFDIGPSGGVDVNIVGAGIVNKSTALSIANGGRLNFSNASTAGNAAIDNFANVTFNDSATAGNAFLTNRGRLFSSTRARPAARRSTTPSTPAWSNSTIRAPPATPRSPTAIQIPNREVTPDSISSTTALPATPRSPTTPAGRSFFFTTRATPGPPPSPTATPPSLSSPARARLATPPSSAPAAASSSFSN